MFSAVVLNTLTNGFYEQVLVSVWKRFEEADLIFDYAQGYLNLDYPFHGVLGRALVVPENYIEMFTLECKLRKFCPIYKKVISVSLEKAEFNEDAIELVYSFEEIAKRPAIVNKEALSILSQSLAVAP